MIADLSEDRHHVHDIEAGVSERQLAAVTDGVADIGETRGHKSGSAPLEHLLLNIE